MAESVSNTRVTPASTGRDRMRPAAATLPRPVAPLIGRDAELTTARALLIEDAAPLVTLTGPGGVGKTRLALEIGRIVGTAFADGVTFVDLSPIRDPALVLPVIAQALELQETGERPLAETLAAALGPKQCLLILDNHEQVLAAAPALARLLATCPALQILATSRAPLRVRGEHPLPVPPLPLPPATSDPAQLLHEAAVLLFVQRARAAQPGFALNDQNATAVAEICRRLDGLPLALELAAARVRVLSPVALLTRLEKRLPVLTSGARDLPARQQTMREAIAWSHDLLGPEAASLFRQLGVFIDGFDLASAAAIVARDPVSVTGFLEELIDHSLIHRVQPAGEVSRFGMLDTVREFALDQLSECGENDAAAKRHAAYFAGLMQRADALWDGSLLNWIALCDADHANFRATLEWLAANDPIGHVRTAGNIGAYWYVKGHLLEGRRRLDEALTIAARLDEEMPAVDHATVLTSFGLICQMQGDLAQARSALERALARADEAGDSWRASIARTFLGGVLVSAGHYEEAEPLFKESFARWQSLSRAPGLPDWQVRGRWEWAGIARFHLGLVAFARGDWDHAGRQLADAVTLYETGGDELAASDPLNYLALIACECGDFGEAARIFADVLGRLHRRGSEPALAAGLAGVATLAMFREDAAIAARLFGAAARLLETGSGVYSLPARATYEQAMERAQQALGVAAWQSADAAGRAMPIETALAAAEGMLSLAIAGGPVTSAAPDDTLTVETTLPPGFDLTRREREVLTLVCQRLTDPEIAARLFISPRTASSHVANLLGKLGAANRREVAGIAVRNRLVEAFGLLPVKTP